MLFLSGVKWELAGNWRGIVKLDLKGSSGKEMVGMVYWVEKLAVQMSWGLKDHSAKVQGSECRGLEGKCSQKCLWTGPRPHVLKFTHVLRWGEQMICLSRYSIHNIPHFPDLKNWGTETWSDFPKITHQIRGTEFFLASGVILFYYVVHAWSVPPDSISVWSLGKEGLERDRLLVNFL